MLIGVLLYYFINNGRWVGSNGVITGRAASSRYPPNGVMSTTLRRPASFGAGDGIGGGAAKKGFDMNAAVTFTK